MRQNQRGEVATILAISALVILGITTVASSFFVNNNRATGNARASVGTCQNNPDTPPNGFMWKAYCGNDPQLRCTTGDGDGVGDCKTILKRVEGSSFNETDPVWCYGFTDGPRCMKLVSTASSGGGNNQPQNPQQPEAPITCRAQIPPSTPDQPNCSAFTTGNLSNNGSTWKVHCDLTCDISNSKASRDGCRAALQNKGITAVDRGSYDEAWCYGFGDGGRCMNLTGLQCQTEQMQAPASPVPQNPQQPQQPRQPGGTTGGGGWGGTRPPPSGGGGTTCNTLATCQGQIDQMPFEQRSKYECTATNGCYSVQTKESNQNKCNPVTVDIQNGAGYEVKIYKGSTLIDSGTLNSSNEYVSPKQYDDGTYIVEAKKSGSPDRRFEDTVTFPTKCLLTAPFQQPPNGAVTCDNSEYYKNQGFKCIDSKNTCEAAGMVKALEMNCSNPAQTCCRPSSAPPAETPQGGRNQLCMEGNRCQTGQGLSCIDNICRNYLDDFQKKIVVVNNTGKTIQLTEVEVSPSNDTGWSDYESDPNLILNDGQEWENVDPNHGDVDMAKSVCKENINGNITIETYFYDPDCWNFYPGRCRTYIPHTFSCLPSSRPDNSGIIENYEEWMKKPYVIDLR